MHVLRACSLASLLIAKGSVISATLIRSYSAPATYFFSRWHDRQQTLSSESEVSGHLPEIPADGTQPLVMKGTMVTGE
jgi:hypothetical protein